MGNDDDIKKLIGLLEEDRRNRITARDLENLIKAVAKGGSVDDAFKSQNRKKGMKNFLVMRTG